MSESLNAEITGNCKARVKDELATVLSEADRQREIWNLIEEAQRSLRRTAGPNASEPACSVVTPARSNAVNGCAEPVV